MPNRDGRGPFGDGPGTGRGNGFCRDANRIGSVRGWGRRMMQPVQYRCRRLWGDGLQARRLGAGRNRGGRPADLN